MSAEDALSEKIYVKNQNMWITQIEIGQITWNKNLLCKNEIHLIGEKMPNENKKIRSFGCKFENQF